MMPALCNFVTLLLMSKNKGIIMYYWESFVLVYYQEVPLTQEL